MHIEHVALVVDDYDRAIDFYVGTLGFELVEDSASLTNDGRPRRWVVVRPPGARTGLLLARADGEEQRAAVGAQFAERVGLFLRVDDFDRTYRRMLDHGVEFVTEPRDEAYGRVCVFVDVAGNKWDLLGPMAQRASPMVVIRRLGTDEWQQWRAVRLRALEEAPHAFGSRLQDWQGEGDREARWRNRLESAPFNVIAFVDGRPIGQASGSTVDEHGSTELTSMWVAPSVRGRGVGDALIAAVNEWATGLGASSVTLAVKPDNSRAIAFYERLGFVDIAVSAEDPSERTMVLTLPSI